MSMKRIALMTVAALSISTLAIAGEKEATMKRPAILPAMYVTSAAVQAMDVYSTTMALKAGARESNPVAAPFAGNPGSMIGLKVVSTASAIYFTEKMWKTNPVKAVLVLAAINSATAMISMHNMKNVRAASARR